MIFFFFFHLEFYQKHMVQNFLPYIQNTQPKVRDFQGGKKKDPINLLSEFWFYDILVSSHIVGQIALVPSSCGFSSHFSHLFFSLPLIAPLTTSTADPIHWTHQINIHLTPYIIDQTVRIGSSNIYIYIYDQASLWVFLWLQPQSSHSWSDGSASLGSLGENQGMTCVHHLWWSHLM